VAVNREDVRAAFANVPASGNAPVGSGGGF